MTDRMSTDALAKILWEYNCLYHPLKKSECILVLGSNDIRVARRSAEIFFQGFAPLIIFSGNQGVNIKDPWDGSEAEIFAGEAMRLGVPKEKILIENKSTNTGENIEFTKKLLAEKNFDFQNFILVQKPFMQRRTYATFRKLWPEKEAIVTAPEIAFEDYPNDILSKEYIINVLVGDTQRLKVYAESGFLIPQDIPESVWKAFEELVNRGYTGYLIER